MRIFKFVSILALLGIVFIVWAADYQTETIKLRGEEQYDVVVQDGRVLGGYAQGTHHWQILGGAYDGKNLTIIQKHEGATEPEKWMTLHFAVKGDRFTAVTRMNSEGQASRFDKEYRRE